MKKILVFIIVLFGLFHLKGIFAAAKEAKEEAKDEAKAEAIKRRSLDVIIINDLTDSLFGPMSDSLNVALCQGIAPVIVTGHSIYNFVTRKLTEEPSSVYFHAFASLNHTIKLCLNVLINCSEFKKKRII